MKNDEHTKTTTPTLSQLQFVCLWLSFPETTLPPMCRRSHLFWQIVSWYSQPSMIPEAWATVLSSEGKVVLGKR